MSEINESTQELQKPVRRSRKKLYLTSSLIIIILLIGLAGVTYTQKVKQFRDKGPMFFMMDKVTKDLNLTTQQKADVDKIKSEIKAKRESMKQNKGQGLSDFQNAFKQDNLDVQTLKDIDAKRESNRQEMKEFIMGEIVKFHDILTPEQRTKLVDKMNEMKEKHEKSGHDKKQESQ
jgi:Spy/CpxP family protein refolding chaperone